MAFLRASISLVASLRASRSRVSARSRNAWLFAPERLGAERLKGLAKRRLRFVIHPETLGVHGAISFELGLEACLRGTRGQPAYERADAPRRR